MPSKKMDVDLESGKTAQSPPPVRAGRMVGGRRHGAAHPGHLQSSKDAKSEHNTSNVITPADPPAEEEAIVVHHQDPPKKLKQAKKAYPPPKVQGTRAANKKTAQVTKPPFIHARRVSPPSQSHTHTPLIALLRARTHTHASTRLVTPTDEGSSWELKVRPVAATERE